MGCYMSKPNDEVHVTEGKGRNFTYATASCQGWRMDQEDAEACIPDYDADASLFILCDGHGGAEVAQYTVEKFPEFLKQHPLYKEGKYEEALKQAFIDFDATLHTPSIMKEIVRLAFGDAKEKNNPSKPDGAAMDCKDEPEDEDRAGGSCSSSVQASGSAAGSMAGSSSGAGPSTSNGASSVADDVDVATLRREAQLPIEELISKYACKDSKGRILSLKQASLGNSPVIKSKDHGDQSEKVSTQNTEATSSRSDGGDREELIDTLSMDIINEFSQAIMSSYNGGADKDEDNDDDDDEDDSEFEGSFDSSSDEIDADDDDDDDDDADGDEDGDDERDEDIQGERSKNKRLLNKKQRRPASSRGDSSSDEDEEEWSTDDNLGNIWASEEDEPIDENYDDEYLPRKLGQGLKGSKIHRPVMDSGCTVVVALVKGNKLYVASAGDSRCIVIMRDGQCTPMSFDHKPEDPIELRRIKMASGFVVEGRVNGGLNLSRAFGDFTYKDTSLKAEEQMITPCPDVKTIDLDPDQVEYIFLACDGIWNSMKNQQVTKYIRKIAPNVNHDLVSICMAVFKFCLAPGTDGDGTGCDNMTCILARYRSSSEKESSTTNQSDLKASDTGNEESSKELPLSESTGTSKRRASEDSGDTNGTKRRCLRLLDGK